MQDNITPGPKDIQWLHQLYMQAPVAVGIYIGEEHIIEFVNPLMLEIWTRSYEQVINKPLFKALPEKAGQGFEEIISNVLHTGNSFTGAELPFIQNRNGSLKTGYFNITYQPLRDLNNNIIGIIQTAIEVTELVEARKASERNEEVLKMALEGGRMGTWHLDFVQNTFLHSDNHDKVYGYFKGEAAALGVDDFFGLIHPNDIAYARMSYENSLKPEGKDLNYEVRVIWPDGSIHWMHVQGSVSFNLIGQPISMSGVVMDITERKRMIEQEKEFIIEQSTRIEVERQRNILKDLLIYAPALIVTLKGPDLVFDIVNQQYQQLFKGRQLEGKALLEAIPEFTGQPIIDLLNNVYRTGEPFIGNEVPVLLDRYNTGQLEELYYNFIYQATRDTDGEINGIFGLGYEVTESVKVRKLIQTSEENLKLALDAGKMGTWLLDLNTGRSQRSLQHNRIFGYDNMQPEWGFEKFLDHVIPEEKERVKNEYKLAIATGEFQLETRILAADGTNKWIGIKGKTFYEEDKPVQMAGVVMDISERKQAEEKLLQLTQKLEIRNEQLKTANDEVEQRNMELSYTNQQLKLINLDMDNFIYAASHDLKAPISNIEGLINLLARTLVLENLQNDLVHTTIDLINNSIHRFKNTIKELTNIAKLQKETEEKSVVNVAEIINDVKLDIQWLIEESSASIIVDLDEDCVIPFSYKNLKSVIYNLMSNAIKYRSSHRKPEVVINCIKEDDCQVLIVKDNGLGIKENDLDKIFFMFKRLHTHVEGTGIGLYFVKRIVDNAGGKLEVSSEEGKGTTFKVYFPLFN